MRIIGVWDRMTHYTYNTGYLSNLLDLLRSASYTTKVYLYTITEDNYISWKDIYIYICTFGKLVNKLKADHVYLVQQIGRITYNFFAFSSFSFRCHTTSFSIFIKLYPFSKIRKELMLTHLWNKEFKNLKDCTRRGENRFKLKDFRSI